MYTATALTQKINIEASSLQLEKQALRRDLTNIICFLPYLYQYFEARLRSILFCLAYITHVFLASSLI